MNTPQRRTMRLRGPIKGARRAPILGVSTRVRVTGAQVPIKAKPMAHLPIKVSLMAQVPIKAKPTDPVLIKVKSMAPAPIKASPILAEANMGPMGSRWDQAPMAALARLTRDNHPAIGEREESNENRWAVRRSRCRPLS